MLKASALLSPAPAGARRGLARALFSASAWLGLISLLSLLGHALAAKRLTPEAYASLALVQTVFTAGIAFADGGTGQTLLRYFLKEAAGRFAPARALAQLAPAPFLFLGLWLAGAAALYPSLRVFGTLGLLAFAGLSYFIGFWSSSVLRSVNDSGAVLALQRTASFGLLAAALVSAAWPSDAPSTAWVAALALAGANALAALWGWAWLRRAFGSSGEALPPEAFATRRRFCLSLLATAVLTYGDRLVAAAILSVREFALYAFIATAFQAFDLLSTALNFVLLPRFARDGALEPRAAARLAALVVLPLAALAALGGAFGARWFFPEAPLALTVAVTGGLALVGALKLLTGMLMGHIQLHAGQQALSRFSAAQAALALASLAALAALGKACGAGGFALALVGAWLVRCWLAYRWTARPAEERGT